VLLPAENREVISALVATDLFRQGFEKKFFSDETNRVFCETFLKNALRDPLSGEIGKSIIFCVTQDHAAGWPTP